MIRLKYGDFEINIKTIFSVIVALIPVLAPYASFVNGIYLEEFLLIVMTMFAIFYKKSMHARYRLLPVYILAIEIILSIFLNALLSYGQTTDVLIRSVRMLFYIICITFTSGRLLDIKKTIKAITFVSVYAVSFLLIQIIVYKITGTYIKGMGNVLPLAYRADFDYQYYMSIMFRPSSIFSEPAAMCEYLLVPLSFYLLGQKEIDKKKMLLAVFISFGCLLTTSLWGIIIVVTLWSVWLFKVAVYKKYFIFLIIILSVVVYFIVNSLYLSTTMSRIDLSSIDSLMNSQAFSGRFLGYEALENLNFFEKLFGLGFGNLGIINEKGTGNSVVYYLLGLGVVGTTIFFASCILSLKFYKSLWQKNIYILVLLLSFGAGTINTCLIMYFFILSSYALNDEITREEANSN